MAIFQLFKNKNNLSELTDSELIDNYKKSDDKLLFAELFKRYSQFAFIVSMKYLKNEDESKEAVLEIFEKLLVDIIKNDIKNFKPWLHSVVKNHCLHIIRKRTHRLRHEKIIKKDSISFMESDNNLYQDNADDKEKSLTELEKAILALKPEHKLCIELFYLKEKSYYEVSRETGFSMKEVKSYLQNGKRNLKQLLSK